VIVMKNMREMVSNALVIGGLITSGASTVDALRAASANKQYAQIHAIDDDLRQQYGVTDYCVPTGFFGGNPGVDCSDIVPSAATEEQERTILDTYRQELKMASSKIPKDLVAERREHRGLAGLVLGSVGVVAAAILEKQKR
jgi:hypothetical protein